MTHSKKAFKHNKLLFKGLRKTFNQSIDTYTVQTGGFMRWNLY